MPLSSAGFGSSIRVLQIVRKIKPRGCFFLRRECVRLHLLLLLTHEILKLLKAVRRHEANGEKGAVCLASHQCPRSVK